MKNNCFCFHPDNGILAKKSTKKTCTKQNAIELLEQSGDDTNSISSTPTSKDLNVAPSNNIQCATDKTDNKTSEYNDNYISFDVSSVDEINGFAIEDEEWQNGQEVHEIAATDIFSTNDGTLTYNVSDVVVVLKNDDEPVEPEYIIASYDNSKLDVIGLSTNGENEVETVDDFPVTEEVVIVNHFDIRNVNVLKKNETE